MEGKQCFVSINGRDNYPSVGPKSVEIKVRQNVIHWRGEERMVRRQRKITEQVSGRKKKGFDRRGSAKGKAFVVSKPNQASRGGRQDCTWNDWEIPWMLRFGVPPV